LLAINSRLSNAASLNQLHTSSSNECAIVPYSDAEDAAPQPSADAASLVNAIQERTRKDSATQLRKKDFNRDKTN